METAERWVLCIEESRCVWVGPEAAPEVEISFAQFLEQHDTKESADKGLAEYLVQVGAVATWADVRPIEECAICGKDFSTEEWHKAITLSLERGSEENPEVLDVAYPALICPKCVPCLKSKTAA